MYPPGGDGERKPYAVNLSGRIHAPGRGINAPRAKHDKKAFAVHKSKGLTAAGAEHPEELFLRKLARSGLIHCAGPDAPGAKRNPAHGSVRRLMPDSLKIGKKTALGLDVGMADIVAALGYFTAIFAFLGHEASSVFRYLRTKITIGFLSVIFDEGDFYAFEREKATCFFEKNPPCAFSAALAH
jgi:hypothetical protein